MCLQSNGSQTALHKSKLVVIHKQKSIQLPERKKEEKAKKTKKKRKKWKNWSRGSDNRNIEATPHDTLRTVRRQRKRWHIARMVDVRHIYKTSEMKCGFGLVSFNINALKYLCAVSPPVSTASHSVRCGRRVSPLCCCPTHTTDICHFIRFRFVFFYFISPSQCLPPHMCVLRYVSSNPWPMRYCLWGRSRCQHTQMLLFTLTNVLFTVFSTSSHLPSHLFRRKCPDISK